jgi:hypothetical protein
MRRRGFGEFHLNQQVDKNNTKEKPKYSSLLAIDIDRLLLRTTHRMLGKWQIPRRQIRTATSESAQIGVALIKVLKLRQSFSLNLTGLTPSVFWS